MIYSETVSVKLAEEVKFFLQDKLERCVSEQTRVWLWKSIASLEIAEKAAISLQLAFSASARMARQATLIWTESERAQAHRLLPEWDIQHWSQEQCIRTLLLLHFPSSDRAAYVKTITQLFTMADIDEQVALYKSLPFLPYPEQWAAQAAEGVRQNMVPVFDAIALNNPYPYRHLSEEAWNQLVLKAVFNDRPLASIQGVYVRHNFRLASTLVDFIHERWSAGRTFPPGLWRFISPFLTSVGMPEVHLVLQGKDAIMKAACVLACYESNNKEAWNLIQAFPDILRACQESRLTWHTLGK
ncbi:MAG: EboA domain-containing protein [Cytophagaceae bacterium]|jgi:hypothetical protein|nr:EboA domain-containing protein [Cytophagaceae bacterium]